MALDEGRGGLRVVDVEGEGGGGDLGIAAAAPPSGPSAGDDAAWCEAAGPLLARVITPGRYPLASRVDGLAALIERD